MPIFHPSLTFDIFLSGLGYTLIVTVAHDLVGL